MSPVRYVGRTTNFHGKRLYDILCRLKNFGVGRMVYRYSFNERYPQPSYYVITDVNPSMNDPTQVDPSISKASATGIRVFRGENLGECHINSTYKADWRLVPKDSELELSNATFEPVIKNTAPVTANFPPLMEYLKKQEYRAKDKPVTDEQFILRLKINQGKTNQAIVES